MALFEKKGASFAVVDIHSSSIGAAYVVATAKNGASLIHQVRTPLVPAATEPLAEAFPRTLEAVLTALVHDGAPLLRKATGSGSVERVVASFASPWQESTVGSRVIEEDKPFIFTRELIKESETPQTPAGHVPVSEMIIATLLNGYEVGNPFGKRARRAELITLSSSLDSAMQALSEKIIRKALHQRHIEWNAFLPEAYPVFRDLYPHQRDFLVLDVGGEASDALLVKHGLLISSSMMPHGVGEVARAARTAGISTPAAGEITEAPLIDTSRNSSFTNKVDEAKAVWVGEALQWLGSIAKEEPLPRTVFLIAEEGIRDFVRNLLDAPQLRSLWLSDTPLSLLPVLPSQFVPFIAAPKDELPDPALALLALAGGKRE